MKIKVIWGILLILTAISLVLYGVGIGPSCFGMPIHKLILAFMFVALIFAKIIHSDTLKEKLKIFTLLSLLFLILEPHIATWFGLAEENIINNWILIAAAFLIDLAVGMLMPESQKRHKRSFHMGHNHGHHNAQFHAEHNENKQNDSKQNSNFCSNTIHYADVSEKRYHYYKTNMGSMNVYYQNADTIEDGAVLELELYCNMGSMVVYTPEDWAIIDKLKTTMASTIIRGKSGDRVTLILTGTNNMGSIVIN